MRLITQKSTRLFTFFLIGLFLFSHTYQNSVCVVEQVHISYGKYFSDKSFDDRYYSVMMVTRDLECSIPKLKIFDEDSQFVEGLECHTETFYDDPDYDYKRRSFIYYVPKSLANPQYSWRAEGEANTRQFPARASDSSLSSTKWIVVADMDQSEEGKPTIEALKRLNPDHYDGIFHVGDYAYDIQDNNGEIGDEFFNLMSPITSKIPYIAIPGNHEKHNKFRMFNYRFKMPGGGKPLKRGSHYFSFNVKGVHFVTLNWDWGFMMKPVEPETQKEMFEWLEEDLRKYWLDPETNFLVFLSHRPFNCGFAHEDCFIFLHLRKFKALLKKYKVDLILNGHKHKYYRLVRLDDFFQLDPGNTESPLQVISGKSGCKNVDAVFLPYAKNNLKLLEKRETIDNSLELKNGPMDEVALNDEPYWLELEIIKDKMFGKLITSSSGEVVDTWEIKAKNRKGNAEKDQNKQKIKSLLR